jgi:hypothetical protein
VHYTLVALLLSVAPGVHAQGATWPSLAVNSAAAANPEAWQSLVQSGILNSSQAASLQKIRSYLGASITIAPDGTWTKYVTTN